MARVVEDLRRLFPINKRLLQCALIGSCYLFTKKLEQHKIQTPKQIKINFPLGFQHKIYKNSLATIERSTSYYRLGSSNNNGHGLMEFSNGLMEFSNICFVIHAERDKLLKSEYFKLDHPESFVVLHYLF